LPFFGYSLPVSWTTTTNDGSTSYVIHLHWGHLAALAISASILSLLYGANINHDLLLSILRKFNITERTARKSIWNDAFQDIKNRYLLVGLADERTVLGYLRYYSDEYEDASVFLEDAVWLDDKGNETPVEGPGILLTKEAGIKFVAFIDPKTTDTEE
jgi:hypothetical protein